MKKKVFSLMAVVLFMGSSVNLNASDLILLEDNYKQNYDYDPNSPESVIGLSVLQEENLENNPDLSAEQKDKVLDTKSIYDFDDKITAPENGYKNAEDYYHETNSARKVGQITTPLLMISAQNDPWIPSGPYEIVKQTAPDNIAVLIPASGGHVGFHEKGQTNTWHDRQINNFVSNLM